MERLTQTNHDYNKESDNSYIFGMQGVILWGECVNRLAEYENTGLSPQEVEELKEFKVKHECEVYN